MQVTYLAAEIDASASHGPERVPERPYFLYVGLRYEYKNFSGLLAAFAQARPSLSDMALCVVGAPFTDEEEKLIAELGLDGAIEHYSQISDSHLAKLYRCSVAFVYPSLYEGFGLPPLEAMACGAPVVSSNSSSLPEVVGDAALFFDPTSKDEMAHRLVTIADDSAERERLIRRGQERVQMFTWDQTVSATLEIYGQISGRNISPERAASERVVQMVR